MAAVAASATAAVLLSPPALADSTIRVSGNTVDESAGENGSTGWWFTRDQNHDTPFEFNFDEASIGHGSLHVLPIGPVPGDKFIAENFLRAPVDTLQSISYDYLIAGNGTTNDADQFYLNVYANVDDSTNFYDCRFDYTPTDPADLDDFATASFDTTATPTRVAKRGTRIGTCPATLAGMPEGSHVRVFSINVGGTTAADLGLAGYLDNVRVATDAGTTTYDFEPAPAGKSSCKGGDHFLYGFASQGACISSLQANGNAGK